MTASEARFIPEDEEIEEGEDVDQDQEAATSRAERLEVEAEEEVAEEETEEEEQKVAEEEVEEEEEEETEAEEEETEQGEEEDNEEEKMEAEQEASVSRAALERELGSLQLQQEEASEAARRMDERYGTTDLSVARSSSLCAHTALWIDEAAVHFAIPLCCLGPLLLRGLCGGCAGASSRPPLWSCARRGTRPNGLSTSLRFRRKTSTATGAVPPVSCCSSV